MGRGRSQGYLESIELAAYDGAMNVRPLTESPDPRLVIIAIDRNRPLGDRELLKTLQKLQSYQPKAIELDIYRDRAVDAGHSELTDFLQQQPSIVSTGLTQQVARLAKLDRAAVYARSGYWYDALDLVAETQGEQGVQKLLKSAEVNSIGRSN